MSTLTTDERKQIAQTTLLQLGGRRFLAMTGAKHCVFGAEGDLSFQLPIGRCGAVRIELTPMDVYKVTFYGRSRRPAMPKVASEHDNIYAEDLVRLFERETGLSTRL